MKYIKKFNNNENIERYIKNNFASPHMFLDVETKNVNYLQRYKRLTHISSTSTGGQYINLGCKLLENTDDIQIDIKFNIKGKGKDNQIQPTLIAAQPEVSPYPGFALRYEGNKWNCVAMQAKWQFTGGYWINQNGYRCYSNKLGHPDTYNAPINTIYEISEILNNVAQNQISNFNCHLFCALNSSNNPFRFVEADLYYLRLYKGGHIVRNLIPVQRNLDNEVGLWDMENQVFYTSQGNEPFIGHEL